MVDGVFLRNKFEVFFLPFRRFEVQFPRVLGFDRKAVGLQTALVSTDKVILLSWNVLGVLGKFTPFYNFSTRRTCLVLITQYLMVWVSQ